MPGVAKKRRVGEGAKESKDDCTSWDVKASAASTRFTNPIRALVDTMKIEPHPDKEMIPLSIGDPTKFGNFGPPPAAVEAVVKIFRDGKTDGYPKSSGLDEAREALAKLCSTEGSVLTKDDVVIASGCSGAIDIAMGALADEGTNVLVPAPGFSLYRTLAESKNISTKSYRCLAEKGWEIDLAHLESLIDSETRAIIVTNPSNPCGSNFTREHVLAITEVAARHKVPIIADEIYAGMVFEGSTFTSLTDVGGEVPVLCCGGLAKRYLAPGWRVGWICVHDRNDVFAKGKVQHALVNLSQLILGACAPVQAAIPAIIENTPAAFYTDTMAKLKSAAELCFGKLDAIPGLKPVMPTGAMYLLCGIDIDQFPSIEDDRQFTEMLVQEQSVFCLPAQVFEAPNYFRIVTTVPPVKLAEAMDRIAEFCKTHHK